VVGATPAPVYPAGPSWCADPGAQCVEPPLGEDNPALEASSLSSSPQATGDPVCGDVAPSNSLDVERRGAGSASFSTLKRRKL
jgi:hypothetical protein